MDPILVTGAPGKIASAVTIELLSRGVAVRALVRREDARSERLRARGAQIVAGDLRDYDDLVAALRGTTRAFYLPPMDPFMLHGATAFALAAGDAKLRSIVALSQWLANPASPSLLTRGHWLADRLFARIPGVDLTIVNPGFFADNVLAEMVGVAANLGVYPWPYGDSLNAWPSNEDIARVAVAALLAPERHAGHVYRPTGPRLLSGADIARTLARALGRPVKLLAMPDRLYAKALRAAGLSPFVQHELRTYDEEQRRGAFAYNAPTDHVLRATGHPPEPFEVTVERYAALSAARVSFGSRFAAIGRLLAILATPAPDLERYARRAQLPSAPAPRLSILDARWLAEHAPPPEPALAASGELRP